MKKILVIFFLGITLGSYSQDRGQLRVIGTNVFDFSPVIKSFEKQEITSSPYCVSGEVFQANDNGTHILRKVTNLGPSKEFSNELLQADTGMQLKMLFASKKLEQWRSGELSTGELMAMDPQTKQIILDEIEREKSNVTYVRILVTNCPNASVLLGKQVQLFAMPAGTYTFTDSENHLMTIPRYDYGLPYSGMTSNLTIYLVTRNGLTKSETLQEAELKKLTASKKLLEWQIQQASNGVAYVQFDLAKRYLNGNGVQKDEALGRYWLQRSADQNYEPAVKFLKQ